MDLIDHIDAIKVGIRSGRFTNEASVSQGIVLRLLGELGWPTYDIGVVCPEYSLSGRRVDFALCGPAGRPLVFVEVKQIGKGAGAEQQLFEYAFHEGVQFAVLTDGQEWNFFLPAEQGTYGERRVYKLDIVERDIAETAERLKRYLHYHETVSGAALAAAREDFKNAARLRQMDAAIPKVWQKLLENDDELLIELVADSVEDLCGYKPEPDMIAAFLKVQLSMRRFQPSPTSPSPKLPQPRTRISPQGASADNERIGYTFRGTFFPCRNGRDVLSSVLLKLVELDSSFLPRFSGVPKHGRSRRFVATTPQELYPGRPDLASEHSMEIVPGWWLGTNVSKNQIRKILEMACGVAGVQFGSTLVVHLGV